MSANANENQPTSQDAARRLLVLKYIVAYALMAPPRNLLDAARANSKPEETLAFERFCEQSRDSIGNNLRHRGLWEYLSPREVETVQSTFLTMTHQQHVNASWRIESAQALMWALGAIERLPGYDEIASPEILKKLPGDIAQFIRAAQLRPREEIEKARNAAELWHWRSRTRQLIEHGEKFPDDPKLRAAGLVSFEDVIRVTVEKTIGDGRLPPGIDGDFPAKSKAYRDLSPTEWAVIRSITVERHTAFNWLCGRAPGNRWDETPTPT